MKATTVVLCALAATGLAACSSSPGTTTAPAPTNNPAAPPAPPSTPHATPAATVTVTAAPPVTVTANPSPSATPAGSQVSLSGPFQPPSGNIECTMFTSTDGLSTAECAAIQHDWVGTQHANCHVNWGSRVDLEKGSAATFGCYGQGMPPPTHTLQYGQYQTLGSLSCTSDTAGIMCIDNDTGHYFSMSRETVHLG